MSTDNKNDNFDDIELIDIDNDSSDKKFSDIAKEVKKTMDEVKQSDYVDTLNESSDSDDAIKEFAHKQQKPKHTGYNKNSSILADVGKGAKKTFKGISGKAADIGKSRSEEHTSELQSHRFVSYAVFCGYGVGLNSRSRMPSSA